MSVAKLDHYGLLHAAGADARAFLHAQLTNDLENSRPGARAMPAGARPRVACWRRSSSCPHADGYLLQLARDLVPSVLKRLSMFILRSKVKLSDASAQWTQYGVWDRMPESRWP
jgi:folate-binding Fe-S cluster repair protein YgfZ